MKNNLNLKMALSMKLICLLMLFNIRFKHGFGYSIPLFPFSQNVPNGNFGDQVTKDRELPVLVRNDTISNSTSKPTENNTETLVYVPVIQVVPEMEEPYPIVAPPPPIPIVYSFNEANNFQSLPLEYYQQPSNFYQQSAPSSEYFNFFPPSQSLIQMGANLPPISYYPYIQVQVDPASIWQSEHIHETSRPTIVNSAFQGNRRNHSSSSEKPQVNESTFTSSSQVESNVNVREILDQQTNFVMQKLKKIVNDFAASNKSLQDLRLGFDLEQTDVTSQLASSNGIENTTNDDLMLETVDSEINKITVNVTSEVITQKETFTEIIPGFTYNVTSDVTQENKTTTRVHTHTENSTNISDLRLEILEPETNNLTDDVNEEEKFNITAETNQIDVPSTSEGASKLYPPQLYKDEEGNLCWREVIKRPDNKTYYVFTCEKNIVRSTTPKSDILHYTNELHSSTTALKDESMMGDHDPSLMKSTTENPELPQVLNDYVEFYSNSA